MSIEFSERVLSIQPSPTLAITALAAKMRAEGKNIISLAAGEPDFHTPEHVKQAAIKAIQENFSHYTAVDGIPTLKQAIVNKLKKENNLEYQEDHILVSCGAKHSLFNLTQALLNQGDEVIIPVPYWTSYPDMVRLAGGTPVFIQPEQNFKITPQQLQNAITKKTKLFIINSPSNPTGVVYDQAELKALAEVLLQYPDIIIATDDIYEHIRWSNDKFINILNVCPALYDNTVVINGVSKSYAMTGWRIGYIAAANTALVKNMKKIQSQSTSNPTSIAQVAAQAALEGDQSCLETMRQAFKQRHDYIVHALDQIPGITCSVNQGAFYCFPDFTQWLERFNLQDDIQLGEFLLEKAEIALVPGSAFGLPNYARISFATSMQDLETAIARLKALVV